MDKNKYINVKRFTPDVNFGLTLDQVENRILNGIVNIDDNVSTKTVSEILKNHAFTLFNFINLILALAILYIKSYRNLVFMGVVVCNFFIGALQEIRSKKIIEKLNLISSNFATIIRDGKKAKVEIEKVVLDDIILYSSGNQIIADAIILEGKCEVNESLITGESDLISKDFGDMLLSGSYIVSGSCKARVENVGKYNYASTILKESKNVTKTKSEVMTAVNRIIKLISISIFPIGVLLFYRQFNVSGNDLESAILTTSAALTGMIPQGLVLLTSSILAVGVIKLSKKKVLVQDLCCIETLARVDTLCLDKTGTITEGSFEIDDIIPESGFTENDINTSLCLLVGSLEDKNETLEAFKKKFTAEKNIAKAEKIISFSSERKWSGAFFQKEGSLVLGAPEFIFFDKDEYENIQEKMKIYSKNYRVVVLAKSRNEFIDNKLPAELQLMGFILIKDKIRHNAKKTLEFFKKQNVDIKIISGDNPLTVSKIAERVGLENASMYIDASLLNSDEIKAAALKYTVFGRVSPFQKKEIVKSLQKKGRTVSMVGDGINDVLAMKASDCSVAMASSSDVTRSISHLVLLDSDFSSMVEVVAEGRRAVNNITRSSSFFLIKTIYSFLLSIFFFFIPAPYPFIQIQGTLISTLTIGIPSFILALEPNKNKIKGDLFKNIVKKSLPVALTVVTSMLLCALVYSIFNIPQERYSTLTVVLAGCIGLMFSYKISTPLNKLRKFLIWGISVGFGSSIVFFDSVFEIEPLNRTNIFMLAILMFITKIIYKMFLNIFEKLPRTKIS
ncbi:MAG: HAD-IC family P-type ATPase [Firmicutes bacterium]|nr:HAD-IC family P-type ATPase [Bacillota bacterium]